MQIHGLPGDDGRRTYVRASELGELVDLLDAG